MLSPITSRPARQPASSSTSHDQAQAFLLPATSPDLTHRFRIYSMCQTPQFRIQRRGDSTTLALPEAKQSYVQGLGATTGNGPTNRPPRLQCHDSSSEGIITATLPFSCGLPFTTLKNMGRKRESPALPAWYSVLPYLTAGVILCTRGDFFSLKLRTRVFSTCLLVTLWPLPPFCFEEIMLRFTRSRRA